MQTLFIPDVIEIEFLNAQNKPWQQEGVMLGIQTKANYRNDIGLSPFLTDENGRIRITREDIQECYQSFVSYGLMDYSNLENAKPEISLYYLGTDSINNYIAHWRIILENKERRRREGLLDAIDLRFAEENAEREKIEREKLSVFENCYNRQLAYQKEDIVFLTDKWSEPRENRIYSIHFNGDSL